MDFTYCVTDSGQIRMRMRFVDMTPLARWTGVVMTAVALAGCQGSGRFTDFGGASPRTAAATRPTPLQPVPLPPVQSAPLPPVQSQALPPPAGGLPPIGSTLPIETPDGGTPRSPRAVTQEPIDPEPEPLSPRSVPPQVAARQEPVVRSGPPSRTSVTGNWTAREAAGSSCRVVLTSVPTLDLYRASTSGCQSRELQRVNAWELRGEEVYLYEPGGGVAARLKQAGRGFEGSSSRTGAPITLSK